MVNGLRNIIEPFEYGVFILLVLGKSFEDSHKALFALIKTMERNYKGQ